jgi:adenylate cyclase
MIQQTIHKKAAVSFFSELKRRNVIRIAVAYLAGAWLLIQVIETLLPIFGLPETMARNIVIIAAIGFVPALILAWVFEWTPSGIRRESESETHPVSAREGSGSVRTLDRWIIVALVAALGLFAIDRFLLDPRRDARALSTAAQAAAEQARAEALEEVAAARKEGPAPHSIAVLPFVNMSDDRENEYFSDGVAEELLNLLAKIPQLAVAARTSSFSFKDSGVGLSEIAGTLNVANILEGSVRKAGNRVRVTAQLIEAETGFHLWSETYERELEDVFAVQDDIAANVAQALQLTILGEAMPHARETSSETYTLYLQGLHFRNQSTLESLEQAQAVLQEALSIDPDYHPARILLGNVLLARAQYGAIPLAEGEGRAREALEQVLAAEPENADALGSLAWILIYRGEFDEAGSLLTRALARKPGDAQLVNTMAFLRRSQGRLEEAIPLFRQAMALDPVRMAPSHNLSFTLYQVRRYDEAIASFKHTMDLSPDYYGGWAFLAAVYLVKGDLQDAKAAIDREQPGAWKLQIKAMVEHDLGNEAESMAAIRDLQNGGFDDVNSILAMVHSWRGETDVAFEYLEAALDAEEQTLIDLRYDPLLDKLRSDPRWPAISAQIWSDS